MSSSTNQEATPKVHEVALDLSPGAEIAIGLVAVPQTTLQMRLSRAPALKKSWVEVPGEQKWQRLELEVALTGSGTHLPDRLPCNVLCKVERTIMGVQRSHTHDAGTFSLEKGGDGSYSLVANVDVVAASLLGEGTVGFSVAPIFPHAAVVDIAERLPFNIPLDLLFDGLALGASGADPKVPKIGDNVRILPKVARPLAELDGFAIRATIVEEPAPYTTETKKKVGNAWVTRQESKLEDQKESIIEVLVWRAELKARTWIVGTSRQDAYRYLTCYKANEQGDWDVDIRLEVSLDRGATYAPAWRLQELGKTFAVKKPALSRFKAELVDMNLVREGVEDIANFTFLPSSVSRQVVVDGCIDGFSKRVGALQWNLAMTIWGARPIMPEPPAEPKKAGPAAQPGQSGPSAGARPRLAVEPVATQTVPLQDNGEFGIVFGLDQLPSTEWASKGGYSLYFATFSFDRQATNTPEPQPITEIIAIDAKKFHLAVPEDLFEGATVDRAVEVCSEGLPGEPVCIPHIGSIGFAFEGEKLALRYHLVGGAEYWSKAKVSYGLLALEAGKEPKATSLRVSTPKNEPRVRFASMDMADPAIFGKDVEAVASVESPIEHEASHRLRCVPALVGPIVFARREDGSCRFYCGTHYVPTHLSSQVTTKHRLRFAFYEELADVVDGKKRRIPLGYLRPKHDLSVGDAGLCAPSGLFGASLTDPKLLDDALRAGRVLLVAESPEPSGKLLGIPLAPLELVVPGSSSPRSMKYALRFGKCVSSAFKKRVIEIAGDLTTRACKDEAQIADFLMTVMACETGGQFLSSTENSGPGKAVGLVQFIVDSDGKIQEIGDRPGAIPTALKALQDLGAVTPEARRALFHQQLKAMPPVEQLEFVRNYLYRRLNQPSDSKAPASTLEDYYCCILYPAAVGEPESFIIGLPGSKQATQNSSLCDNDGIFRKRNACQRIREWKERGEKYLADEKDDAIVPYSP